MDNRGTIIELKKVRVHREHWPVLDSIDLSVKAGDRIIIAGKNGAGKTTLLKTILGLIPHQSGEVRVLGLSLGSREWLRQRRLLGYVDQDRLQVDLPISAFEVSEIGACLHTPNARRRREVVEQAMRLTGCEHLGHRLYEQLSGGERQKVSLARCLSQHARILILDEPTSSLDPASRRELMQLLKRLNEELRITILMATHDSDLLSQSDWRIHRLEGGKLLPVEKEERAKVSFLGEESTLQDAPGSGKPSSSIRRNALS